MKEMGLWNNEELVTRAIQIGGKTKIKAQWSKHKLKAIG